LFKLSYTDKTAPQPVLAYARNSRWVKIAFDRSLNLSSNGLPANQCSIVMGKYVTAGEANESFRPGYQAVKNQRTMPRYEIPVQSAARLNDEDELTLFADDREEAVNYAISLPGSLASHTNRIELLSDLTGVTAEWTGPGRVWGAWLPHLDLTAARGFTRASRWHKEFFDQIKYPLQLQLRTQLDLWQMLRPETQPDSTLDFEHPPETVTVVLKAHAKLEVKTSATVKRVGESEVQLTTRPKQNEWLPLEVTLPTGGGDPRLDVSWFTSEDLRPRPMPLRRVLLPWAKPYVALAVAKATPEIDGGNWVNGKKIFFGEQAACSKCHKIGGEGGSIGADLSNLIFRDYASVLKDIVEPSAAINPDHISYNVQLTDGEFESGVLLKHDRDQIVLGQVTGKSVTIPREKIVSLKASAISLMPEGLLDGLSAQEQKDLMTFLLNVH
jgi:putative heme-binding domain-containing protein